MTLSHGTRKHYSVGNVQKNYRSLLLEPDKSGNERTACGQRGLHP